MNLALPEEEVRRLCLKQGVSISAIEPLQSGGTRLVCTSSAGANPTPMAYAEVYTGLQTGAIDGQDNPLPNVENMKFYEVMSQIVLTSHLVGFDLLTVSKIGRAHV